MRELSWEPRALIKREVILSNPIPRALLLPFSFVKIGTLENPCFKYFFFSLSTVHCPLISKIIPTKFCKLPIPNLYPLRHFISKKNWKTSFNFIFPLKSLPSVKIPSSQWETARCMEFKNSQKCCSRAQKTRKGKESRNFSCQSPAEGLFPILFRINIDFKSFLIQ